MTTNESEKVLAAKVDETQTTTTTTATATAPTATKTCELVSVSLMLSISGSSVVTFMYDSIVSSVGTIVAFFSSSSSSSGKDDTTKSETNVLNHVEVVLDEKVTTTTTEHDNEKETSALPSPLETPSTMIDEEEINEIIKEIVFDVTRPDECLVEDIDAELKI